MERKQRIEGAWSSKAVELMRRVGYNKEIDIELATVTNPLPSIRIKVDGMKIELDSDDLIVDDTLVARTETVLINGTSSTIDYPNRLNVGDRVIVASIKDGQTFVILGRAS